MTSSVIRSALILPKIDALLSVCQCSTIVFNATEQSCSAQKYVCQLLCLEKIVPHGQNGVLSYHVFAHLPWYFCEYSGLDGINVWGYVLPNSIYSSFRQSTGTRSLLRKLKTPVNGTRCRLEAGARGMPQEQEQGKGGKSQIRYPGGFQTAGVEQLRCNSF